MNGHGVLSDTSTLARRGLAPLISLRQRACLASTYALPLDLFRVLVGLLSFAYFLQILWDAPLFSDPNGLIDHALVQELFWYTRLSLFQPGMGLPLLQIIFALACCASLVLVLGYRVKLVAGVLFVIAVSTYRWNFLTIYVDDGIMHLLLAWMLLLPVGHTLVLQEWLTDPRGSIEGWKQRLVPALPVYCFLANLALVYLVAGLWKWASPMWRHGIALYAILKLPIAYHPDFWQPRHLPMLMIGNYLALLTEPVLPLLFVLPARHPLKWPLGGALIGFHLGILATLKIPYANLALPAALVIIFRDELMQLIRGCAPSLPRAVAAPGLAGRLSVLFVGVLIAAMLWDLWAPTWRAPTAGPAIVGDRTASDAGLVADYNPVDIPLWLVGIAQSYRLFDWIDERNFYITYDVIERDAAGKTQPREADALFPSSLRSILLQTHLHGVTWTRVASTRAGALTTTLYTRYAARYCRSHAQTGRIEAYATVQRITAENLNLGRGRRELLMQFQCRYGKPVLQYARRP